MQLNLIIQTPHPGQSKGFGPKGFGPTVMVTFRTQPQPLSCCASLWEKYLKNIGKEFGEDICVFVKPLHVVSEIGYNFISQRRTGRKKS